MRKPISEWFPARHRHRTKNAERQEVPDWQVICFTKILGKLFFPLSDEKEVTFASLASGPHLKCPYFL